MAVASFDSRFSFRQDAVARLGDRGNVGPMTAADRARFMNAPVMQVARKADNLALQRLSDRDKKRLKNEPGFRPQDSDFEAPKAHKYDTQINYYKVLGVDEYCSQDQVKKAYRKMSLTYHPDKTTGKDQQTKDEYAAIFIEVKNAYKTLSDNPTRRQYDYDRDRSVATAEVFGKKKPQDKPSFDAMAALRKLAEQRLQELAKRAPTAVVEVPVLCRLEKFIFGGQKAVVRSRKVRDREAMPITGKLYGYSDKSRTYHIDLPPGAAQPFPVEFRRGGDQHEERETDTLKFLLSAKQHEVVYRSGLDLHVRQHPHLGDAWHAKPFLQAQMPTVRGRHILLWGRNPFFHCAEGAGHGELRVSISGEGIGRGGVLRFTARLGLAKTDAAAPAARSHRRPGAGQDQALCSFLAQHGLGPSGGLASSSGARQQAPPSRAAQDVAATPAMRRRLERVRAKVPVCELSLLPLGQPVELFTRPPCSVSFYTTRLTPSGPMPAGVLAPTPVFAISISSPACAKKRAAADWERLKAGLVPLLQLTGFKMMHAARSILPKPLPCNVSTPSNVAMVCAPRPVPWKALGDRALTEGDAWIAMRCYSHSLAQLLPASGPGAGTKDGVCLEFGPEAFQDLADRDAAARVLCNRAACFAKCGDWVASRADATMAAHLVPSWGRPWARLGLAAQQLGDEQLSFQACAKAVEQDPSPANVSALRSAAEAALSADRDAAHAAKEHGNDALRAEDFGAAVSLYTTALARLPPAPLAVGDGEPPEDRHALLRAVLLVDRSIALCRLRCWEAAVVDGRHAVAAMPHFGKGRCQLGTALLGMGLHEEAYVEFAKATVMDPENSKAMKGRNACLAECLLWRSLPSRSRFRRRFHQDLFRPRHMTKVFAASGVHFDRGRNEEWSHAIDDAAFQNDVLIVAGDLADSQVAIRRGLTTLRSKFRRVFYTVGGHEMNVAISEFARYPDSVAKLFSIMELCDELGVDFMPAAIGQDLFVVPMFSWYNAEFDEKDPFPDASTKAEQRCKWPIDPDMQVWKYMLNLNEASLERRFYGTIISFSNFLPRRDLPYDQGEKGAAKTVGCVAIDEQVRRLGSKLHVFGRSGRKHSKVHDGVRYVQHSVSAENEVAVKAAANTDGGHVANAPLLLVYDGKAVCSREVGISGEDVHGPATRLLHVEFFIFAGIEDLTLRKLHALVTKFNTVAGVKASFAALGSEKLSKAAMVQDVWRDFQKVGAPATHGLIVVADDLEAMRRFEQNPARKTEWPALTIPFTRRNPVACVSVNSPLGVDLVCARKRDPVLVVLFLWLKPALTPESDAYQELVAKVEAINKMPGVAGKLQASLQCTGFGPHSGQALAEALQAPDKSAGCTHCFTLFADEPPSIKALVQSKTFERYRNALAPHFQKMEFGQPEYGGALPLKLAASVAAPAKAKK